MFRVSIPNCHRAGKWFWTKTPGSIVLPIPIGYAGPCPLSGMHGFSLLRSLREDHKFVAIFRQNHVSHVPIELKEGTPSVFPLQILKDVNMKGRESTLDSHRLGIISDTHGILRPEVWEAFRDVEMIIHAGDVGRPEVLSNLKEIAPVVAVRGNVDRGNWALSLPTKEMFKLGNTSFYVIHDLNRIDLDPAAAGISAVIFGHSHRPLEERRNGILYLNPGSAGPGRFRFPVSLAILQMENGSMTVQFVPLENGE